MKYPKKQAPPIKASDYAFDKRTAQARYDNLAARRENYLTRARECSALTIPALIPQAGFNATQWMPTPYQSVGARGVTSLTSKLILALFPPNSPFFRFKIPEELIEEILARNSISGKQAVDKFMTEVDTALSKAEKRIMWAFETNALRTKCNEAASHLIVGGNVLLHFPKKGNPQVFHLDHYVCQRSPTGEVLEIIVKEEVAWGALPKAIREVIQAGKTTDESTALETKLHDVYTRVCRQSKDDDFTHYQECEGYVIPDTDGKYSKSRPLPWLPLRWRTIDGESYGRGFVEEFLGDLASLESLVRSTVVGAAVASKVIFLVKPNSTTRIRTLTDTPSGAVREGNADDVGVVQVGKTQDFQFAANTAMEIERRLNEAFLLAQSVKRNAERVTATEIQMLAQELEDSLGGVYTLLSQEFQRPIVNVLMESLRAAGALRLPAEGLEVHIITGLEALGRGADLRKLDTFLAGGTQILGPSMHEYVNAGEYLQRRATSLGIEAGGLIRSEEEVQTTRQQQMQMMAMQQNAGDLIKGAASMQKNTADAEASGVMPQGSTETMMRNAQAAFQPQQ